MDWQDRAVRLLRREIEDVLSVVPVTGDLGGLVREPLEKLQNGLYPGSGHDIRWSVLPLMVCMAISGRYKRCLPAAAAFQFFQAAADVFDDIEDADSPDSLCSKYGVAAANSAASTLLILGEYSLTRLKSVGVDSGTVTLVIENVNSCYITACAGQHLDLTVDKKAINEDLYLKIATMKTASQVKAACRVASLLAAADDNISDIFTSFGDNLGMASQLTNDIQGIIRGTDIIKAKATLPIIYAFAVSDNKLRSQLETIFISPDVGEGNLDIIKNILYRTGAIHYATVKMEYYKNRAKDSLVEAERLGCKVERLRVFLQ